MVEIFQCGYYVILAFSVLFVSIGAVRFFNNLPKENKSSDCTFKKNFDVKASSMLKVLKTIAHNVNCISIQLMNLENRYFEEKSSGGD